MLQFPLSKKQSAAAIKPIVAGGLIVALAGLLIDFSGIRVLSGNPLEFTRSLRPGKAVEQLSTACTGEIISAAQLSREQLAQLLTVPERESKQRIRQIVEQPYCQLASLNVRAGVESEREAYPLEFAPDKTFIILYEDGEYAGYDFKL
ncbi:hypothetical protein [cf. Phormidesmis sp. LEGE 11477]|uniref:hypothetical protein n=1 Tax=cf. Phormidesmis sp. LEGE 11477 TaxID=1828680 RepID=UPI00351D3621